VKGQRHQITRLDLGSNRLVSNPMPPSPNSIVAPANTRDHFTILDELQQPNSTLTRAVLAMAQYQTS
jgi:hypothetical protein